MSQRNESGLTAIEEGKLTALAIRKGWIGAKRFDTRQLKSELAKTIDARGGDATLIEKCCMTAHTLVESENYKEKAQGAAIIERMERQNLAAEKIELELNGFIGRTIDPLLDSPPPSDSQEAGTIVNNTQINFYIPDNGRGPAIEQSTNGHSANGKH